MLQRVQSIFLAFVFVSMIVSVVSPHWQKFHVDSNEVAQLTAVNLTHYADIDTGEKKSETWTVYIGILALLASGVAVYSTISYKNRLTQIKLGALNSLLMGAALILSVFYSFDGEKLFNPGMKGAYLTGFYAIFAGLIFNLLANRFIRRDERLVRSVDRIR